MFIGWNIFDNVVDRPWTLSTVPIEKTHELHQNNPHFKARPTELYWSGMHLKVGIFIGCIAMQLILLQADGKLASTDLDEAINEGMKRESLEPLHKLSRQRRYLVFPEGSSFQFGKSNIELLKPIKSSSEWNDHYTFLSE